MKKHLLKHLEEIAETMTKGESTRRLNVDDAISDAIEEITSLRNQLEAEKAIINRLQMALADTEALETGTAEKVKQLQTQLESEKVSHEAWGKQSLLEYSKVVQERDVLMEQYQQTCRLVAQMHLTAMGGVVGPKRGVVEDIADMKAERDELRDAIKLALDESPVDRDILRDAIEKLKDE